MMALVLLSVILVSKKGELIKGIVFSCITMLLLYIFSVTALAVCGRYTMTAVIVCDALYSMLFGGYLFHKRRYHIRAVTTSKLVVDKADGYLVIFIVLASILYMGFPTKDMIASRDPGLYLLNGVHIAQEGKITYDTDELLNNQYDELEGIVREGYPGLFSPVDFEEIKNGTPGDISAQFMPMFPSGLALGYSLFGLEGLIRVNGLIAIFSLLLLYYFAKDFLSNGCARWLLPLMLLNPAQLWGGRLTETEILAQLLYFLTMYIFMHGWKEKNLGSFLLSGFLLGISVMNRMDSYIYGVGLWAVWLYCIVWKRSYLKELRFASAMYMGVGIGAFIYGVNYSTAYFIMHFKNNTLNRILALNIICCCVCILAEVVFYKRKWHVPNVSDLVVKRAGVRKVVFGCFFAGFLFLYFLRPQITHGFEGRAAVEFTWYTTLILVLFSVYGVYKYLEKNQNSYEKAIFFLVASISSLCLYIIKPSISQDHIWAARRWVSVSIPFILMFGIYGIQNSCLYLKKVYRGIAGAMLMLICVYFGWRSSPFMFKRILPDIDKQYEALASVLSDDEIYFTSSADMASYLKFMYKKNVYRIDDLESKAIIQYLKKNGQFWFIGNTECLNNVSVFHEEIQEKEVELGGTYLMESVGAYPKATYHRQIPASISRIVFRKSKELEIEPSDLSLKNGVILDSGEVMAEESGGLVFYGPYLTLDAGVYELTFQMENNVKCENTYMEVTSELGEAIIKTTDNLNNGMNKINFELLEMTEQVEFKLYTSEGSGLVFKDFWLQKLN